MVVGDFPMNIWAGKLDESGTQKRHSRAHSCVVFQHTSEHVLEATEAPTPQQWPPTFSRGERQTHPARPAGHTISSEQTWQAAPSKLRVRSYEFSTFPPVLH